MSRSAESVQDTADLDAQVDVMLREADAAAEAGPILRQSPQGPDEPAADGAPAPEGVDDGVAEAVDDAAQRREPAFEDAASVLGELDELDELDEVDAAGIDELDAMLAERAVAAVAPETEPELPPTVDFDAEPADEPSPADDLPAPPPPSPPSPPPAPPPAQAHVEPARPNPAPPTPVEPAAAQGSPALDVELGTSEGAMDRPRAAGIGAMIGSALSGAAGAALGGVSRRLESLSPAMRQTISWAACLTAINAAAIWTVILLRWSSPALPETSAGEAPRAAAHAPAKSANPSSKSSHKAPAKSHAKGGGGH